MKMREQHIAPLSTQSIEALKELQTLTGGSRCGFPGAHERLVDERKHGECGIAPVWLQAPRI
jgi:hypothetical protein